MHTRDETETIAALQQRIAELEEQLFAATRQMQRQNDEFHLFKLIVERANDGIGVTDAQGRIIYSNQAHRALFGYGDEIIGMSVEQTVAPEGAALLGTGMQAVLQQGSWRGESVNQRKDGSTFPVEVSVFTVPDAHGAIQAMVGVVRDISARKQAEEQLRIFQTMVESSPYSITISSPEGLLTYANSAHQQAHGYTGSPVGIRLDQLMPNADELQVALSVLIATGRWAGVITHQRADGSTFPMQCDAFFVYDQTGAPISTIVIERDVSDDVRQEQERAALQQQIIEVQQAAIRELSTPLLPIADHVLVMPLVGSIDSGRAHQVMETLLTGVAVHQANLVILDITGVQVVDTQVANAFVQAAQAVQLLGAEVLITGIQPVMAQTLVSLGADLGSIKTRSTLQAGIAEALRATRSDRQSPQGAIH